MLSNGGWSAVVRLARAPGTIFEAPVPAALAAGRARGVRDLLDRVSAQPGRRSRLPRDPSPPCPSLGQHGSPRPSTPTDLLSFPSSRVEAFTFTLLELGDRRRHPPPGCDPRLGGTYRPLSTEEREAVVAHELGHIRELDGRYLTFFRTSSRMMRWDPILAYLANRLTEREELRADLDAVEMTSRPRALARALLQGEPRRRRDVPGSSRGCWDRGDAADASRRSSGSGDSSRSRRAGDSRRSPVRRRDRAALLRAAIAAMLAVPPRAPRSAAGRARDRVSSTSAPRRPRVSRQPLLPVPRPGRRGHDRLQRSGTPSPSRSPAPS